MVFIRTCKEVHRLVAVSMDRRAGIIERAAVRLHLAICESCRRFTRQMHFLREAIGRYPGEDDRR